MSENDSENDDVGVETTRDFDIDIYPEPDWQWSTGRSDSNSDTKKGKKRFVLPGEKKQLKKLHMARLREERAERKLTRRKGDRSNNKEDTRWIDKVREAFEILARSKPEKNLSDSDDDEQHLIFTNVPRVHVKLLKALASRYRFFVNDDKKKNKKEHVLIVKRTSASYVPEPNSKEDVEIADIIAPIMSREEYLNNPERLECLRKFRKQPRDAIQSKKEGKPSMFRKKRDEKLPSLSANVDFVPRSETDAEETNKSHLKELRVDAIPVEPTFVSDISRQMMEKMGFESGTGLGPRKDGIKTPIEVTQRKKNQGLGS